MPGISHWLDGMRSRLRHPSRRKRSSARPSGEQLEARTLLTIVFDSGTGFVQVTGDGGNNVVSVEDVDASNIRVTLDAANQTFARSMVNRVVFNGQDGDDTFTNQTDVPSAANGQNGADTLTGGDANDTLSGNGGNDVLTGNAGNDVLNGGSGRDRIEGGAGNDLERGQGTAGDSIIAGPGDDTIDGGGAGDRLIAAGDLNMTLTDSALTGGYGTDSLTNIDRATLRGGVGNNTLNAAGFSGFVAIIGFSGNDHIRTGQGGSRAFGGAGRDTMFGGNGGDKLRAQGGAGDRIFASPGNDTLDGGSGTDRLVVTADANLTLADAALTGLGNDVLIGLENADLTGGAGDNVLDATGFSGSTTLRGAAGNDTLRGGSGVDSILGGDGDDEVSGGAGNDRLFGNDGADVFSETGDVSFTLMDAQLTGLGTDAYSEFEGVELTGGAGANTIDASAYTGPSTLNGGAGADVLMGGTGDDVLDGGDGDDTLTGGAGTDVFRASVSGGSNFLNPGQLSTPAQTDTFTQIESASLIGSAGSDTINASSYTDPVTIRGGDGNDTLLGGTNSDVLDGGGGNDRLTGQAGGDTLDGAAGDDLLFGSAGSDHLIGGDGNDHLQAQGGGQDSLTGGAGNDTLDGGSGSLDRIVEAGDVSFTLTSSALTGLGTDTVISAERAQLTGGSSDNVIDVSGFSGNTTLIGGLGSDTITGGSGTDTLIESGTGTLTLTPGSLTTGSGNNTFSAVEVVEVDADDGANLIDASGFGSGVTIRAAGGDDTIIGSSSADRIEGGDGDDVFTGGLGNDSLFGAAGNDMIVESADADFVLKNGSLTGVGTDFINLFELAQLTGGAGNNSLDADEFSGAVTLLGGDGNDFLRGTNLADSIEGGAGNDDIRGLQGNDVLNAGAGLDTVRGHEGDDFIDGGDGADNLLGDGGDTFVGAEGNDTVIGGDGDDTLRGDGGNDVLMSQDGSDVGFGGAGDDTISGGLGNDVLNGDAGVDMITGDAGMDVLSGGDDADMLVGADDNDTLNGDGGNDTLQGNAGNDQLNGGMGNDRLEGDVGDDVLVGNAGNDLLLAGAGNDDANGDGGLDTLIGDDGLDTLRGGDDADSITGGNDADRVDGGSGSDTIHGDAGNDDLRGDDDNDTIRGGTGADTIRGGGHSDLLVGQAGNDQLLGDDGDTFTGTDGNDTLFGEGGADILRGDDGMDSLHGGGGNDTLRGGAGDDTVLGFGGADDLDGNEGNDLVEGDASGATAANDLLEGGDGNDTLLGRAGDDTLRGEAGNDSLDGEAGRDSVTGGDGDDIGLGGDGQDTLLGGSGLDTLSGGAASDSILGQDGADVLSGDAGMDTLRGGAGNDSLDGGTGADELRGDEDDDTLNGGDDNDSLFAGTGNDNVTGGDGVDTLRGEEGNDTLAGDGGDDDINGQEGNDSLLGGDGDDAIDGRAGDDTISGGAGDDSIRGVEGNDLINGDAGSDTLDGLTGNDTLNGGDGNDILLGRADEDMLDGGAGRDVLSGGLGADGVTGGADDDIVIGTIISHEGDFATLDLILASWTSGDTYATRIAALEDSMFAGFLDSADQITGSNTVYDDFRQDTLTGSTGEDWFLAPGEPGLASQDSVADQEAGEQINVSTFGSELPSFAPAAIAKPDYLQTIADPNFGSNITRVTGDPGTQFTTTVIEVGATPVISQQELYWGGTIRNRYLTDSAWNVDGSLIQIRSYDPAVPYQLVLDGDSASGTYLEPLSVLRTPSTFWRWSQDATRASLQYAFPIEGALGNENEDDEAVMAETVAGDDDDLIIEYNALTGQVTRTIELPFNKMLTSKTAIAFVGGKQYVALMGRDKVNPSAGINLYIVDLDAGAMDPTIVAQFSLTDASNGLGADADNVNPLSLRFAPNGGQVMVAYALSGGERTWRLLDVDLGAGSVSAHAQPSLVEKVFFAPGDRSQGFFAANWGHPVFAYGQNGSDVYIVGSAGNFSSRTISEVQTFNSNASDVGTVLSYNVQTKAYRSLNDSTGTTLRIEHAAATNFGNPGYIFTTFLQENGQTGDHAGEIVAFNLENPEGVNGAVSIAHHRTNAANDCYHCQPHPVLSPDGSQMLFGSTWGDDQSIVSSFVVDLSLPAL